MQRVLVLGRGGAGKSTLARELASRTGLPVVELDSVFWSADLRPRQLEQWRDMQRQLTAAPTWILEGDLGPYDDLVPRLQRADTIVLVETCLAVCVWRVLRRGRERADFWRWMLLWGVRDRPRLLAEVCHNAPTAHLVRLTTRRHARRWLDGAGPSGGAPEPI